MPDGKVLIIDSGTRTIRAGFAGDAGPSVAFPSVVGIPRRPGAGSESFVGDEALAKRGVLTLKYPIVDGRILDWEHLDALWRHAFAALGAKPEEHAVLLAAPPLGGADPCKRMARTMFETFRVPALRIVNAGVLVLREAGKTTGVAVSLGEGPAHVVPVYEGYPLPRAGLALDVGGSILTSYLGNLLKERGRTLTTHAELEILRAIKEALCYVALDFDADMSKAALSSALERNHELPDGESVTLGNERFRAPEALFEPSPVAAEQPGLHELVYDAIAKADADLRAELYANIVLGGGTAMFDGLAARLEKEVQALAPPAIAVHVIATQTRKDAAWRGGSILAGAESPSALPEMWITRAEYDEHGPAIVERKVI